MSDLLPLQTPLGYCTSIFTRLPSKGHVILKPGQLCLIVHDKTLDPEVAAHIARVGIPLFERQQVG